MILFIIDFASLIRVPCIPLSIQVIDDDVSSSPFITGILLNIKYISRLCLITIKKIQWWLFDFFLRLWSKRCSLAQQKTLLIDRQRWSTIPFHVPYSWPCRSGRAAEGFRDQLQSFKKLLIAIYLWMALIRLYLLHSKAINIQLMRCAICHPTTKHQHHSQARQGDRGRATSYFRVLVHCVCNSENQLWRVSGQDNGRG